MEKRIFKYAINLDKRDQEIFLPEFAEVLSVQVQHGQGQIWALVDEYADMKPRKFFVFVTGAIVKNADRINSSEHFSFTAEQSSCTFSSRFEP